MNGLYETGHVTGTKDKDNPMSCEEKLNALRQAGRELAQFRERHLPTVSADSPTPVPTPPGPATAPTSSR